jgi:hypothetical protein
MECKDVYQRSNNKLLYLTQSSAKDAAADVNEGIDEVNSQSSSDPPCNGSPPSSPFAHVAGEMLSAAVGHCDDIDGSCTVTKSQLISTEDDLRDDMVLEVDFVNSLHAHIFHDDIKASEPLEDYSATVLFSKWMFA